MAVSELSATPRNHSSPSHSTLFETASQNMAFASALSPSVSGCWTGIRTAAFVVTAITGLIGACLIDRGHSKVAKIKRDTTHAK